MFQNATPAQRALLHAGESALRSAGLTIAAGVYQYVATNGLNIPGLLTFLGIAFVAQLAMIDKSIKSNPQLQQAALDTGSQVKQSLDNLTTVVGSHGGAIGGLIQKTEQVASHLLELGALVRSLPIPPTGTVPTPQTAVVNLPFVTPPPTQSSPFVSSPLPSQQQFPSRFTADVPAMSPRG